MRSPVESPEVPSPTIRRVSIRELYEARFVPLDESPLNPVSIVFLELPKELAEVAKKPFKEGGNASEWLDVDVWIRRGRLLLQSDECSGRARKTSAFRCWLARASRRYPVRLRPKETTRPVI